MIACPGKHGGVVLYSADHAWMIWPVSHWWFEDDSLVVALALTFGLDAVGASRSLLTTLYAALPTGKTPSLGPLSHLGVGCRP
jgi:hypothetical protein